MRLRQAIHANAATGNLTAHVIGLVALGLLQTLQGRRRAAVTTYRGALELLDAQGPLARGRVGALLAYGEWLREQNLLVEAEQQLALGLELAEQGAIDAHILVAGAISLVRLHLAAGDLTQPLEMLGRYEALLRARPLADHLAAQHAATRATVALAVGDRAAASRRAARLVAAAGDAAFLREHAYLALARVWLAEACRRVDSALRIRALQVVTRHQGRKGSALLGATRQSVACRACQRMSFRRLA